MSNRRVRTLSYCSAALSPMYNPADSAPSSAWLVSSSSPMGAGPDEQIPAVPEGVFRPTRHRPQRGARPPRRQARVGTRGGGSMARSQNQGANKDASGDVDRYRQAAEDALQQLDWAIMVFLRIACWSGLAGLLCGQRLFRLIHQPPPDERAVLGQRARDVGLVRVRRRGAGRALGPGDPGGSPIRSARPTSRRCPERFSSSGTFRG